MEIAWAIRRAMGRAKGRAGGEPPAMPGIVKASRRPLPVRPLPVRPRDRYGGFPKSCGRGFSGSPMLVDGARGSRYPASPRHALLAESPNLEAWGKPSL